MCCFIISPHCASDKLLRCGQRFAKFTESGQIKQLLEFEDASLDCGSL